MKKNYNYARLNNGVIEYAPNKLIIGTEQVFNAPAEIYATQGYLPVVQTERSETEEGFCYSPVYTEKDGKIIQEWEKHEIPVYDEASETDYINALEELGVNFNE